MVAKLLKLNANVFSQQEFSHQFMATQAGMVNAVQPASTVQDAAQSAMRDNRACYMGTANILGNVQTAMTSLAIVQPSDVLIVEMEHKLKAQAVRLAKLEQELHSEKISRANLEREKANLEIDFEHAIEQLKTVVFTC